MTERFIGGSTKDQIAYSKALFKISASYMVRNPSNVSQKELICKTEEIIAINKRASEVLRRKK